VQADQIVDSSKKDVLPEIGNEEADLTSPTQTVEGAAAAAAEGLDGPDAIVELVGDDDVVVVEAAAEADGACGVLVVLEGDDDGRVDIEAGALQATSSYLSINISVLLHNNYSTRSTQQLQH
jgi:hypothetical protein